MSQCAVPADSRGRWVTDRALFQRHCPTAPIVTQCALQLVTIQLCLFHLLQLVTSLHMHCVRCPSLLLQLISEEVTVVRAGPSCLASSIVVQGASGGILPQQGVVGVTWGCSFPNAPMSSQAVQVLFQNGTVALSKPQDVAFDASSAVFQSALFVHGFIFSVQVQVTDVVGLSATAASRLFTVRMRVDTRVAL
jgi:hypothetical protein